MAAVQAAPPRALHNAKAAAQDPRNAKPICIKGGKPLPRADGHGTGQAEEGRDMPASAGPPVFSNLLVQVGSGMGARRVPDRPGWLAVPRD